MIHSNPNFIAGNERLQNRVYAQFRNNEVSHRKTFTDIKLARKDEMEKKYKAYYKKKIIEERELPKYHQYNKEWWKISRNPKTSNSERSRTKLMQTQKFWAKPDKFVTAEIEGTEAEVDPFKREHHLKSQSVSKIEYHLPTSPNKIKKDKFIGEAKHEKTEAKWSTLEVCINHLKFSLSVEEIQNNGL